MKKLSIAAVIALGLCLTACAPANQVSATGKHVNDGWHTNEQSFPAKDEISMLDQYPYRKGITPEGYVYTIFPDGSAGIKINSDMFSDWSISCIKDAMSDRRNCKISSYRASLFISYGSQPSPKWICISGHDFPHRNGTIRFDNGSPMTTDFDGCISGKYAKNLSLARTITTRSYKWPYDYSRDATASLKVLEPR